MEEKRVEKRASLEAYRRIIAWGISALFVAMGALGCAGNARTSQAAPPLKDVGWMKTEAQRTKLGELLNGIQNGGASCEKLVAQFHGKNAEGQELEITAVGGKVVVRKMKRGRAVRRYDGALKDSECRAMVMMILKGKLWKAPMGSRKKGALGLAMGSSETGLLPIPDSSKHIWRQQTIQGLRQQLLGLAQRVTAGKR